ncbi:MAG TPA: alkaline phosphatase family protein [Actinomycetota bacterium]|nr:alkaline phosphatase family protein [Actinomycetota bacterium]
MASPRGRSKAAVIGLDGAAWHLLDPLLSSGVMPRLAALRSRGAWGTMRSTVPTYTPPAWTSAATGVNPGRHGIYGFVEGHAQVERPTLAHSGRVKSPTIWEMAGAQGVRTGVYNLPLTYPPQPLDGWMVSGMMTPGYGERQPGFASWNGDAVSEELVRRINDWAPGYVLDISANYEQDWRDDALARRALGAIRQRKIVLERLLELDEPDVLFSVQEAPDRLQHVYYRYLDPADEMHDTPAARAVRPLLHECFAAIDEIVGLLDDWAGDSGGVIVCSDHGFTRWEMTVHLNALLARWGYFALKPGAAALRSGLVRKAVPVAKRFLPRRLAREAKGRTFSAVDWERTRAFASPIPQQGIIVNVRGREPQGVVDPDELESVKDDLTRRLLETRAPDGAPLVDEVHRSEDVFHGDAREGAPDLLPVMRDHRYENSDEIFHKDPFSDVRHMPRGVHHMDGIVAIAGPGARAGARIEGHVMDVTPTLLYLAGLAVPEGLDGRVLTAAFEDDHLRGRPIESTAAIERAAGDGESPYSREEEAMIEESLRGLGYL